MIDKYQFSLTRLILMGLSLIFCITLVHADATEPDWGTSAYRIGPEDQIAVTVWQQNDLSLEATVGPDGKINYPLIGDMTVSGLTRQELQIQLTESLKKYLVDPKVNVNIIGYNSPKVRVLGMVASPGLHPVRGKYTLVHAIAQAGGVSTNAQLRQVAILRGTEKILEVDLYKILYEGMIHLDVPLEPNDTIFVPDNRNTRVFVLGYVNQPGIIDINQNLTVLESIMRAGGYVEGANLRRVAVIRGDLENPEIIYINVESQIKKGIIPKNQNLKAGDIVFVHRGLVAGINYLLDQVSPALRTIIMGDSAKQALEGGTGAQVVTPIQ